MWLLYYDIWHNSLTCWPPNIIVCFYRNTEVYNIKNNIIYKIYICTWLDNFLSNTTLHITNYSFLIRRSFYKLSNASKICLRKYIIYKPTNYCILLKTEYFTLLKKKFRILHHRFNDVVKFSVPTNYLISIVIKVWCIL